MVNLEPMSLAKRALDARASYPTRRVLFGLCLVMATVTLAAPWCSRGEAAEADGPEYLRTNYTKHEYRISMRDGMHLFTAVYVPKDLSKTYPILLMRTPYGVFPYGEDSPVTDPHAVARRFKDSFMRDGYIFAFQDVRGRMKSEGEFVHVRPYLPNKQSSSDVDESSDAFDTVDWLVKHVPANNGRVGVWGVSYPGFYATCALIDAHPAVKAVSPQAPVTDWFMGDDLRHNGAFFLAPSFNFEEPFEHLKPPTPVQTIDRQWESIDHGTRDGYEFFSHLLPLASAVEPYFKGQLPYWREIMEHDTYDSYWQARNIRAHIKDVGPAVLTVGGWFDAEDLFGTLETYRTIEANSPKTHSTLVMGPWAHGGWGETGDGLGKIRFDAKTAEFYQEKVEFAFFSHYLKDAPDPGLPEALVFETGSNQWQRQDSWPPKNAVAKTLYFQSGQQLVFEPPVEEGYDEYTSDPWKPVPFIEDIEIDPPQDFMIADQRFASRRPDVLVYQTGALEEPVTVAGPIQVNLQVSTTGTDSDFIVKLIDVYPETYPEPTPPAGSEPSPTGYSPMGGYQQLVRGEPFRGKFRNSFEHPEPFVPGEAARIDFRMPDVYHTFRTGHRIMVQVQSSWFPLVDRNPQVFTRIGFAAPAEFQKATQRVYHGGAGGSSIRILVVGGA